MHVLVNSLLVIYLYELRVNWRLPIRSFIHRFPHTTISNVNFLWWETSEVKEAQSTPLVTNETAQHEILELFLNNRPIRCQIGWKTSIFYAFIKYLPVYDVPFDGKKETKLGEDSLLRLCALFYFIRTLSCANSKNDTHRFCVLKRWLARVNIITHRHRGNVSNVPTVIVLISIFLP